MKSRPLLDDLPIEHVDFPTAGVLFAIYASPAGFPQAWTLLQGKSVVSMVRGPERRSLQHGSAWQLGCWLKLGVFRTWLICGFFFAQRAMAAMHSGGLNFDPLPKSSLGPSAKWDKYLSNVPSFVHCLCLLQLCKFCQHHEGNLHETTIRLSYSFYTLGILGAARYKVYLPAVVRGPIGSGVYSLILGTPLPR